MNERPLKQQQRRPVGLVTGPKTVRGEWSRGGGGGKSYSWDRVPRGAVLFTPSVSELWPMVETGAAQAFKWKNHGIVSFDVGGRKVISLRDTLHGLSRDEQYVALIEFVNFVRSVGANIGSIAGMSYSMWRSTLKGPVVSIGGPRIDRLMLGARIENHKNRGRFFDVNLWDLASAYSSTIGTLNVPRKWAYRKEKRFDWDSDGYVRAEVNVPECWGWGPLGVEYGMSTRARELLRTPAPSMRFPTDTVVRGMWTADEIRAAESAGCEISVVDWWEPLGAQPIFAEWWQLVLEGRRTLSKNAQKLLKWGANTLWGKFAANGQMQQIYYDGQRIQRHRMQHRVFPHGAAIAGMVAGKIRSRLYVEGIQPFAPIVLSCHTDGVFLPKGVEVSPNGGAPGSWRVKKECEELILIDAQTYKYISGGEVHYIMAGVTNNHAAIFEATLESRMKRWKK